MTYIILAVLLVFIIVIIKKPYLALIYVMILLGFAPIFDHYLGNSSIRFGLIALVFIIQLLKTGVKRRNEILYIFFALVVLKEIVGMAFGATMQSFIQAMYTYVIVIGIVYFSYWEMKKNRIDFLRLFSVYIVLCLGVLFYRTLFDYSFHGLALNEDVFTKYSGNFEYGSYSFRPSSFESPIIFSIQLSIFISWLVFKEGITKRNALLLTFSTIGLLLTFSRSGLLMLMIAGVIYAVKSKKSPIVICFMALVLFGLMVALDYTDRFLDVFKIGSESADYQGRFNSINTVWRQIASFDISELFLGLGYGVANNPDDNGDVLYYVENYYFTLFINSGFFALLLFLLYYLKVVIHGVKRSNYYSLLCLLILLVNCLACSLYANTVFMLLFFLSLCAIHGDTCPLSTIASDEKR